MAKASISEMLRARNKASAEAEKLNKGFDYMADDVQGTEDLMGLGGLAFERPRMINAPVKELHAFHTRDIGFKPYDDTSLESLAQSIKEDGLMQRIKVRPDPSGSGYEILAGHNRAKAMSEILNMRTIPAELYNVDDDQAAIIAVTTNVKQRHYLRPSERALAYRALMEAKRHQGKFVASDWGEGVSEDDEEEIATQKTTRDKIAVMFDVDRNNVQRFLRLSYLIPELLDYADNKSLSVIAGVQLSYYSEEIQKALAEVFKTREPMTIKVAKTIRKKCPETNATVETFMKAWDEADAEEVQAKEAVAQAAQTLPMSPTTPAPASAADNEDTVPESQAAQAIADAFPPIEDTVSLDEQKSNSAASESDCGSDTEETVDETAEDKPATESVAKAEVSDAEFSAMGDTLCDKAQEFAVNPSKTLLHEIEKLVSQIKSAKNW